MIQPSLLESTTTGLFIILGLNSLSHETKELQSINAILFFFTVVYV